MRKLVCDHDLCREPFNQDAYVVTDEGSFCVSCYLIHERGMDAAEVAEIVYQGDGQ